MFMVLFMGPAKCEQVGILRIPQNLQALVDQDIVNKEVGHTVQEDAQPDIEKVVEALLASEIKQRDGWQGKNYEEQVIPFKISCIAVVMMIPVQDPKAAMHDIFMNDPGCAFHQKKCTN
jgi:hypothetical protein